VHAILCHTQTSQNGSSEFQVGVVLDLDSPVGSTGLTYLSMAHSDFYSAHSNYTTKLVLRVSDSRGNVIDAATSALSLLKDERVDAIIGPQKSEQANFVLDLGERAHVPIISFSATSPSLLPQPPQYFLQTAQSDDTQVRAIAAIIKSFQWRDIVMIFEDTVYGKGIVPYLANALQDIDARIAYRSVFPLSASDDFILKELYKMMTMQTRVFVVQMSHSLAARLFLNAKKIGMMNKGYAWIMTSGLMDIYTSMEPNVKEAMQEGGVFMVVPVSYKDVNNKWTFLKPLRTDLWVTSIGFFILTGFAIWVLEHRINVAFRGPPSQHVGMMLWFPFSTLVFAHNGSFVADLLINLGFNGSNLKSYKSAEECNEALSNGSQNNSIAAFFGTTPHINFFLSKFCKKYMKVGPIHRTDGYAFVFPKGSPLVSDVSRAVIKFIEGNMSGSNLTCTGPEHAVVSNSISLESFAGLFGITGGVTTTCLLLFLVIYLLKNKDLLQRSSLWLSLCAMFRHFDQRDVSSYPFSRNKDSQDLELQDIGVSSHFGGSPALPRSSHSSDSRTDVEGRDVNNQAIQCSSEDTVIVHL
ncbi:hypothetical protein RJ639_002923, partial [Escallonia herrerae]